MGRKVINLKKNSSKNAKPKKKAMLKKTKSASKPRAKQIAKIDKPKSAVVPPEPKLVAPAPVPRAPVRKVIRDGISVVVENSTVRVSSDSSSTGTSELKVAAPALNLFSNAKIQMPMVAPVAPVTTESSNQEGRSLEIAPTTPKFSWTGVPKYIPAQIRFALTHAGKECEAASTWPFPFAKFIAALPKDICGVEFGLLILALDRQVSDLADLCGLAAERIESLLASGRVTLIQSFSTMCPEIYRRWRVHIAGEGREPEGLVEQHLVMKVNRDFQIMLCAIIVQALGVPESFQVGNLVNDRR